MADIENDGNTEDIAFDFDNNLLDSMDRADSQIHDVLDDVFHDVRLSSDVHILRDVHIHNFLVNCSATVDKD